ncbi:MAG: hypothetical protein KDE27_13735 [Planctomycetes bacterium]|nr:hypothetical protein [Planctomycetota bacterium]
MTRIWTVLLFAAAVAAQNPTDPTSTSLDGLVLGSNPDCSGVPRHWQWPLPPNACYRTSVLSILGEQQLAPIQKPFSYVTGHTDPATGREFALLSAWNGLAIVDCHEISVDGPTRLVPRHWVFTEPPALGALHRGTASYGEFVYESHSFRPSLRVFRVSVGGSSAASISVAQLPDVPLPNIGTSYRLTVDKQRGHLYVPSRNGLFIYDVSGGNGAAPQLLAVWKGWQSPSVMPSFDVHVQREGGTVRAVVSEYLTPGVTHISILDVTNLPTGNPPVDPWIPPNWCSFLASVLGSGNAHSAWMSEDNRFLYSSIGDVATVVYDMQNFAYYNANRELTLIEVPPRVTVPGSNPVEDLRYPAAPLRHMGLLGLGYTGYVSSWQEGLILYDVRPANRHPYEILAQLDTCYSASSGPYGGPTWNNLYPGSFAIYRAQDSGVIYVSDDVSGLYLVRVNVGHMHRYGQGSGESYNGDWLIPRITAEYAPPREQDPQNPDPDQRITIRDLVPGRAVMLLAATAGRQDGVPFPDPQSTCSLNLAGLISAPIFAVADASGRAEVAVPPVLPEQFRLFLQAWSFQSGSTACAASTRGTWFGLAARQ